MTESSIIQSIVLGLVQGITEWLPISSEGAIVFMQTAVFGSTASLTENIQLALWLHLGTALAAVWYFRREVGHLLRAIGRYGSADLATQRTLKFLVVSTLISGGLGMVLLKAITGLEAMLAVTATGTTLVIGGLLLMTGLLQLKAKRMGSRPESELRLSDGVLLGLTQAAAVLPGLSRSGLTVSVLLLRGVQSVAALRLSFLMSIPMVLAGNVLLNLKAFALNPTALLAAAVACVSGAFTIHLLLQVARRVNFGYFALLFGVLVILSTLV